VSALGAFLTSGARCWAGAPAQGHLCPAGRIPHGTSVTCVGTFIPSSGEFRTTEFGTTAVNLEQQEGWGPDTLVITLRSSILSSFVQFPVLRRNGSLRCSSLLSAAQKFLSCLDSVSSQAVSPPVVLLVTVASVPSTPALPGVSVVVIIPTVSHASGVVQRLPPLWPGAPVQPASQPA
jgi:hypothetical protein